MTNEDDENSNGADGAYRIVLFEHELAVLLCDKDAAALPAAPAGQNIGMLPKWLSRIWSPRSNDIGDFGTEIQLAPLFIGRAAQALSP